MAWFSRFTRFGDVHLCYSQEAANSCGIGCVMMVVFKMNKLSKNQAIHKEKEVYKKYSAITGSPYDGSQYSNGLHLATALSKMGVGSWECVNVGPKNVSQAIVDSLGVEVPGMSLLAGAAAPAVWAANQLRSRTPIILHVGWGGGGAHFVVVDTVNTTGLSMYASVCDPWDGNVHITKFKIGSTFKYVGAKVPYSWDLGGKKNEYKGSSNGTTSGWIIRKKS